ncbi:magnesium transporter MgtE N-terminal domain-containing protein [Aliagarivorans marinus]|uniref:magnesium transporter MgtE N-terminal domain-containing protein n=1 Tax=Aliagarivorans marinus TaxID=561965 RepID=UPI000400A53E|nr:hypothetical protein [Aliagarivorans marinus]
MLEVDSSKNPKGGTRVRSYLIFSIFNYPPNQARKLLSKLSLEVKQELFLESEPKRQLGFLGRLPRHQILPFLDSLTKEQRENFEQSLDDKQKAKLQYLVRYSPIFLSDFAYNSLIAALSLALLVVNYLLLGHFDVLYVVAALELGRHSFWVFPSILILGMQIASYSRRPIWSLLGTCLAAVCSVGALNTAFSIYWGAPDEVPVLLGFSALHVMLMWLASTIRPQWFKDKAYSTLTAFVIYLCLLALHWLSGWWALAGITWVLAALFCLVTGFTWGTSTIAPAPSSNPLPNWDDSSPTVDRAISCCGGIFTGWFGSSLILLCLIAVRNVPAAILWLFL